MSGCTNAAACAAKLCPDLQRECAKEEDEIQLLDYLLEHAQEWPGCTTSIAAILEAWYDAEVVTEDGILRWYSARTQDCSQDGADTEEPRAGMLSKVAAFVKWLEEAEEESDDEE